MMEKQWEQTRLPAKLLPHLQKATSRSSRPRQRRSRIRMPFRLLHWVYRCRTAPFLPGDRLILESLGYADIHVVPKLLPIWVSGAASTSSIASLVLPECSLSLHPWRRPSTLSHEHLSHPSRDSWLGLLRPWCVAGLSIVTWFSSLALIALL